MFHVVINKAVALALFAAVLVPACEEQLDPGPYVINRTHQAIDIYYVVEEEETQVVSLSEPLGGSHYQSIWGNGWLSRPPLDGCTRGELVARAPDGTEVARFKEELCYAETWIIEDDGTSSVDR